jgi:hypothetical protein
MTMFDYEYMKQTVVMCAYMMIMIWDLYVVGYLIVKLAKWIWKKLHKTKAALPESETE